MWHIKLLKIQKSLFYTFFFYCLKFKKKRNQHADLQLHLLCLNFERARGLFQWPAHPYQAPIIHCITNSNSIGLPKKTDGGLNPTKNSMETKVFDKKHEAKNRNGLKRQRIIRARVILNNKNINKNKITGFSEE